MRKVGFPLFCGRCQYKEAVSESDAHIHRQEVRKEELDENDYRSVVRHKLGLKHWHTSSISESELAVGYDLQSKSIESGSSSFMTC